MNETDLALRTLFDRLVPEREEAAEWEDVLRRAARPAEARPSEVRASAQPRRAVRRRGLALVAVALAVGLGVALSPVGSAIADRIGDFSAWFSGDPGEPATPAEQQAFQRAEERSWATFAPDTKLRRLIETEFSGTSFILFGFRSGDDLCLRLVAKGAASATSTHCAPLHALQAAKTPAVVVATDEGIGATEAAPGAGGYIPVAYSATFGIASDGVQKVVVHGDEGTREALVGGNAFLYVADHPKLGARVRSAEAIAADGSHAALGLQSAPFGDFDLPPPPRGEAQGPSRVERRVRGGSLGWVERLEPRGDPIPDNLRERLLEPWKDLRALRGAHQLMAREIQPDPGDFVRLGIVAASSGTTITGESLICLFTIDRAVVGGGCSPLAHLFDGAPFTVAQLNVGASQYSLLSGLVSDDVASLEIFLASRSTVAVPLRDNGYVARVARSDYPIRLVAYDGGGRVIGIQTFASDGATSSAPPEARTSVHLLARVAGDRGGTAVLKAGKPAGGYRCWSIKFSDGQEMGGCSPWPITEPPLLLVSAERSGGDVFLTGQLPTNVSSLTATYTDGEVARIEPIDGFLVYAIPSRFMEHGQAFVAVRALDAGGRQIAERGFRVTR